MGIEPTFLGFADLAVTVPAHFPNWCPFYVWTNYLGTGARI